ncbi:ATPase, AAA family [Syntrophobacter sp. SbD1]|nr:ATPase, AAA family [Syntrophobacter sp. SbD1]
MTTPPDNRFSSLTEGLAPNDPFTRIWLEQVIFRMRRELTWLWRRNEPADRLADSLERPSLVEARLRFFAEDPTARYLDQHIHSGDVPLGDPKGERGTFPWLAYHLGLSQAEIFVVALALAAARDAVVGNLIATLNGNPRQQLPTLGLAQWLWDDPRALLPLTSPAHSIFARGVLRRTEAWHEWNVPIFMPSLVAQILEGSLQHPPAELECIAEPLQNQSGEKQQDPEHRDANIDLELLALRMTHVPEGLHVVPVSVAFSTDVLDAKRIAPTLAGISALTGRPIYAIRPDVVTSTAILENAGAYCWLRGGDLLLPSRGIPAESSWQNTLRPYPIYVFAAAHEEAGTLVAQTLPTLKIPSLSYTERREIWLTELKKHGLDLDPEAVRECAFRFRLDAAGIDEVVAALSCMGLPITLELMIAACQQQVGLMIGGQATLVSPRFHREDLVLDAERTAQFDQLLAAMRSLSRVHADWGTGKAWGDAGISALFAGAPGTGKTMAAEVLSAGLCLPMYRVDLSQVVNKYIGETEKNLRKLFDAAEQADIVLFFDEAEALFGQRMQVRNSNDRFANMEISYLLERMERFRGLAILATNRRKDLDEAFLRRLRYVIEFPLPAEEERLAIWKKCIPPQVSTEDIAFPFLAREFALSGGNIRSIVLNACLQSASIHQQPVLSMDTVMSAVDREYEKIGRPLTREQKAQWRMNAAAITQAANAGARQ